MATTPIVNVSNPLSDGTTGSASEILGIFSNLRNQGQIAINDLVVMRENTLILFNNALSELNGKRVRANRVPQIGVAAKFITTDLQDINQSITTATVRSDANSFSLRERSTPGEAVVNQVRFSSSQGTIQALQVPQTGSLGNLGALYRVATANGVIPVGIFNIQLIDPISPTLLIFDMIDMPAGPDVVASISQNGINYTNAVSITQNGYRWGAWFLPQSTQYINLTITPSVPDTLGGNVFTFGLTDFHAFSIQYHLLSDVYTNQIEFTPTSAQVQFSTDIVPGLTYFLGLGTDPLIEVSPGDLVTIPGSSTVSEISISLIAPTASNWAASTSYSVGNQVLDSNGNLQTVTAISGSGTSFTVQPGTVDNLTAVANAVTGNTTYTGSFSPTLSTGSPVVIAGFNTAANNGTFIVGSCGSTSLVVNNPNGVAEAHSATATFNPWSITGGTTIDNPGGNQVTWTETVYAQLNYTLPGDVYLPSVITLDNFTQDEVRVAPGLPYTTVGLTNQYFVINDDGTMYLVPYNQSVDQIRRFDVSYMTGPSTMTASLQVQLTTPNLNTTPIYSGAELLNVSSAPSVTTTTIPLYIINGEGTPLEIGYINGDPI